MANIYIYIYSCCIYTQFIYPYKIPLFTKWLIVKSPNGTLTKTFDWQAPSHQLHFSNQKTGVDPPRWDEGHANLAKMLRNIDENLPLKHHEILGFVEKRLESLIGVYQNLFQHLHITCINNRIIHFLIDPHNQIFVCLSLPRVGRNFYWFLNILLGTHGVFF